MLAVNMYLLQSMYFLRRHKYCILSNNYECKMSEVTCMKFFFCLLVYLQKKKHIY